MTNKDVIKLAELNQKLNSFNEISNVKQVFAGDRDERDPIIDQIMAGKDVYYKINKLAREMSEYYLETYGADIDYTYFIDFIEQLVRILLKGFKLFDDIKEPRAFMISYLFQQKAGAFDNRILAYFNKYYSIYFEPFKNHKSFEQLFDNQMYNKDDIDFCESNKFYVDYFESVVNSKDNRSEIDDDNSEILEEIEKEEIEEDKEWYANDDDILSIADDDENHSVFKNPVITLFDIPYEKYRTDNIALSDQEYEKEINIIRDRKLRKWHIYNSESGYLPHDIKRYPVGGKYFKVRNNTKPDHIYVVCRPKEFNFKEIFFDKTVETYLRNIIIKNLSERQRLLIGYLYFQMMPVDDVINLMGFTSIKALDTEKSRCLKKMRMQILNDYDYLVQEYDETKLAFWAKKIKLRHENKCAEKEGRKLSI